MSSSGQGKANMVKALIKKKNARNIKPEKLVPAKVYDEHRRGLAPIGTMMKYRLTADRYYEIVAIEERRMKVKVSTSIEENTHAPITDSGSELAEAPNGELALNEASS